MFVLKNREGNAYTRAKSEYQRSRLLAKGYVDVTPEPEERGVQNENTSSTASGPPSPQGEGLMEPEGTNAPSEDVTLEPEQTAASVEETTAPVEEIPEIQPPKKAKSSSAKKAPAKKAAAKKTDKE